MLRQIRLSAAVIAMVALPTLAAADQLADQWKICDGTGPADQRIEACTWIIKSGNETKKNIAIAYGNRGAAYRAKDDLDSAIRDYDEVIKLDPKSASSYMFRGNGYRARGDYDRAIADYNTAIRLDRNDAGPLVGRGNIYSAKNEYERAISDYNAALKIRPKYPLAFRNRGIVYSKMKNFDHAIDDYSEAIRLDPTYAEAYDNRGDAWYDKKDYDRAIADYSEAVRLYPSNPTYLNDRCWTRAVAGRDLPQALSDCDQALRIRPNYESALKSRGLVFLKLDRPNDALADYSSALKQNPKNAFSLYGAGLARLRKGDNDGNADLDAAKAIDAEVADEYARYGLK